MIRFSSSKADRKRCQSHLVIKMDPRLHHPFSLLLCGPSFCGKTEFVSQLIRSSVIEQPIDDIVVCYSEWQKAYEALQDRCRFVRGMIDPDDLDEKRPHLVIIDDLQDTNDKRIEAFFVKKCHHRNTSCIYVCQNLFGQGRGHRTCSLNASYIILFASARDRRQIVTLGQQMFPNRKHFLLDSYDAACQKPYSYLLIDLRAETPNHLRLRGRILDENSQDVYVPADYKWEGYSFDSSL